jgi:phosphoadenosine phosphosulfate reductase
VPTGDPVQPSQAAALDRALRDATPAKVIETALATVGREHLALVSSFGTESAALLKVMADVDPAISVVFLDTGWLFEETLAYRDTLIATLGLRDVRSIKPLDEALSRQDPDRELWFSDPDACCGIRKVEPMRSALAAVDLWVSGIRRSDSQTRAGAPKFAWDKRFGLWKLNPLADWTEKQVWAYIHEHDIPYNALHDQGYPSIGCTHCTRKPAAGEDARAGRWAGMDKTECGLHG